MKELSLHHGMILTMKVTVALAQIAPRLGIPDVNLEMHLTSIQKAKASSADLIIFPELSITGYVLQDLAASVAHRPIQDDPVFDYLFLASRDIDIVVGFVEVDQRHRFFIATAYLSRGECVHVHRKVYLPTYGMFDESRYFARGDRVRAFDTRFGRCGMLICEDFWHASPPYLLWIDGADVLIFNSASPGHGLNSDPTISSARWVEHINQAYASLFTSFILHVNRVGYEDGLNFLGRLNCILSQR